ncbi:uncharacterized protein [Rutidosis leptorrhynchoides]|uniref:uncharacterized protein n=1 Tax=Rutidosis leptorrhynchoides TaxID=125765 RepID=UPI003A9969DA
MAMLAVRQALNSFRLSVTCRSSSLIQRRCLAGAPDLHGLKNPWKDPKSPSGLKEENEITFICVDNSEWMLRPGSRYNLQVNCVRSYCRAKLKSNLRNAIGIQAMGNSEKTSMLEPTSDFDEIWTHLRCLRALGGGQLDFIARLNSVSDKLDRYPNNPKRIVFFIGGPSNFEDGEAKWYGNELKDQGIAVDVFNFFLDEGFDFSRRALDALVATVNNNNNSQIKHVSSDSRTVRDVLSSFDEKSTEKKNRSLGHNVQKRASRLAPPQSLTLPRHSTYFTSSSADLHGPEKVDSWKDLKSSSLSQESIDMYLRQVATNEKIRLCPVTKNGEFVHMPATVEVVDQDIFERYKNSWLLSPCPNISTFYGAEHLAKHYWAFAYEKGDMTLREFVPKHFFHRIATDPVKLQSFMRGVFHAVKFIHNAGFCHNNITPDSIFLIDGEPRLHGLQHLSDFTQESRDNDIYDVAKSLKYCFDFGYPRKMGTLPGALEAKNLIKILLEENNLPRPSMQWIESYICFWSPRQKLDFLVELSNTLQLHYTELQEGKKVYHYKGQINKCYEIPYVDKQDHRFRNWAEGLPAPLVDEMNAERRKSAAQRDYPPRELFYLLRLLRNVVTHRETLSEGVIQVFCRSDSMIAELVDTRYPGVYMALFHSMEEAVMLGRLGLKSNLSRFYCEKYDVR